MNGKQAIRTGVLLVVAIGFGFARTGEVHAPAGETRSFLFDGGLDVPTQTYLDLGRPASLETSDAYSPAPAPWQREQVGSVRAPEAGRYLDLGALQFASPWEVATEER